MQSVFSLHVILVVVSGPQPLSVYFNVLQDCRQLWFVHLKSMQWICSASFSSAERMYLQLQCLTAASGSVMGPPNSPVFLLSHRLCPCNRKECLIQVFFPPDGRVGKWYTRNIAVHGVYSPGIDLPPISLLAFCISMFTSLPSVVPRCQSSHPTVVPSVCEVIVHNLWRLWYLSWEWPGFELG